MSNILNGITEAKRSPEPDYDDPSWDNMVSNVGQKAKEGPRKTVWVPDQYGKGGRYTTVPVNAPKKDEPTKESVGLPYPGTYEQTNDMFKSHGAKRTGTLTTEDEQIDELSCWPGYHRVAGTKAGFPGSCAKNKTNEELDIEEDRENFNGINLLLQKDDEEVFVKASAGSRELGHVLFVMDGDYLMPQDLEVEEKYRGQGIAQTMYDFVKSKGYKIRRSGQQTDAGAGFWAKHRPEQNVWEEQHSESCPHCGGEMVSEELMNEKKDACYYKVKSRYKVWPSAYASGALVKCRKKGADSWGNGGKKNESSILEGINQTDESLHDWFNKEKWVRMDTKGNIKGPCAKEPGEGKPKCLPQAKAHSLGKKGRASAAARKRREDPNPDRSGKAINVNTKKEK